MRIIFAGTPAFAAAALRALLNAGHDIPLVLTQPDRPAGRGLKPQPSAVKALALSEGLPLAQPTSLRDAGELARLAQVGADIMVVAAYGLILPEAVLRIPPHGCVNIHASLLPRWRGAAPIQRAILAGDAETGITIMQMDAGLDTGAMLLKKSLPITPQDTAGSLHDRLAQLGGEAIVEALARLDELTPIPQDEAQACYAPKVGKGEARIDWGRDAMELARAVRAYNPVPGAHTLWRGAPLKLWMAHAEGGDGAAHGTILAVGPDGIRVACGAGCLRITELQRAGGRRLDAAAFLKGNPMHAGECLGA